MRSSDSRAGEHGTTLAEPDLGVNGALRLVCPACLGAVLWADAGGRCEACRQEYTVEDGIPVMLADRSAAQHDEIDHQHGHGLRSSSCGPQDGHAAHKRGQAAFYDRASAVEFEISRPAGTPALYGWLLREKFRRSVASLTDVLPGATALTVCGGSGMDAEFLARAGARVVVADISLGAARRARERARRTGLPIFPIVADVEHLPFAERSFDLVYVHDGLHHLERPEAGLVEMARVAVRAVSVTEPARAVLTALAIRAGLALEREEAGNTVARLTATEVGQALIRSGFRVVEVHRYAMYYRHEPGRISSVLSAPVVFPFARVGWRLVNALLGRFGNKLTVQAMRP